LADLTSVAPGEQRVGLVEEQHGVRGLGLVEDLGEVLLGLADVLVDDLRQVDPVQVVAELLGEQLGDHGLAGAGRAGHDRRHAAAVRQLGGEPPVLEQERAVAREPHDLADRLLGVARQHEIAPREPDRDALGHRAEPVREHQARRVAEVVERDLGCSGSRSRAVCTARCAARAMVAPVNA